MTSVTRLALANFAGVLTSETRRLLKLDMDGAE